jgi:hypothetical protein
MATLPEDIVKRVVGYIQHQAKKDRDAILTLVRTSQDKLIDVYATVDEDVATRKPAPDEWSLRELIRHVISAEDGVAHVAKHIALGEDPPPSASARGAGMQLDDDGRPFAAYVDQLRESNARMLGVIRDMPSAPNLEMKRPHPFFGDLNCLEWAVFQRVHDEDHIQHANKIIAAAT